LKRSIEFTHLAERQLLAARGWWRRNRDKAPAAFDEDIEAALALLADNAAIGAPYRSSRHGNVRRYLIDRIRYYIYFRITDDSIQVLRIWHASRGTPPRL
jgi:plasmid stabilization system protein ParE